MEVFIHVRGGGWRGVLSYHVRTVSCVQQLSTWAERRICDRMFVSEQRDDPSLAALYVGTLTILLLHYMHFRIGPRVLLRNNCARASVFHVRFILIS